MDYSVVIPLYNERDNLAPLHAELSRVMQSLGRPYELIFVDDGSDDGSLERCGNSTPPTRTFA